MSGKNAKAPPVDLPREIELSVERMMAAGLTYEEAIAPAWREYLAAHPEEAASDFKAAQDKLRTALANPGGQNRG